MSVLLRARQVAPMVGLGERRLQELAAEGVVPRVPFGKQFLFNVDDVTAALAQRKASGREVAGGLLHCYACNRWLDPDAFLTITTRDKRCKPGHTWTGKSSDCRECRKRQRCEWRRKKAEAAGRKPYTNGEWQAAQKASSRGGGKAQRKLMRKVAWSLCLAFWALVRLSPEEKKKRAVDRQRGPGRLPVQAPLFTILLAPSVPSDTSDQVSKCS